MMEVTIYKFIKNRKKMSLKLLILFILTIFIYSSHKGYVTDKYKKYVFDNLKQKDVEYIERTGDNAADLFLKLSLAKGAVAVIEGSSINIDAVIGGELEVGDIVQPIYDGIDIMWKIALLSTVSLKIQTILIKNTDLSFLKFLLMLSAVLIIPFIVYSNSFTNFMARIGKSVVVVTLLAYFLLPISIYFNSIGTEYINNNYRNEAVKSLDNEMLRLSEVKEKLFQMEQEQEEKNHVFFGTGIKEKINAVKNKFLEVNIALKDISKNIINIIPIVVTVYIINTLLLPIGILFILYKVLVFIVLSEAVSVKQYYKK